MVIGYYVHDHGAGHLTRAKVIAANLRQRGHEVVFLGSDLQREAGITLPKDNDGSEPFVDPDAFGALHWAPLAHAGFSAKMAAIATWVLERRPNIFVVDISAEVVTLLRLLGVNTVLVAQPGDRSDDAHTLAFRCATAILAPWPPEASPNPALQPYTKKVFHTGGISGLDAARQSGNTGVLLSGRDGTTTGDLLQHLSEQLPDMAWVEVGGSQWVDDVGAVLARAAVVVTHCGQNAIADTAAIDIPAVLYAQARPHEEQVYLGAELSRLGLAVCVGSQDLARLDWATAVTEAIRRPSQWARWQTVEAASRAADIIERVGASKRPATIEAASVG
ncbi:hypothetical protein K0651_08535 [Ornithinimicrobium sp. Arc0846-15]|nr:hypothetical protein [Ornithinimicrobium laminariae]